MQTNARDPFVAQHVLFIIRRADDRALSNVFRMRVRFALDFELVTVFRRSEPLTCGIGEMSLNTP